MQLKKGIHIVTPSTARGMIATPTLTSTPLRKHREQERLENKARTLYHPIMDISSISSSSLPSQCTGCKRTECICKRLPPIDSGSSAVDLSLSSTFTLPEGKKEVTMKLPGAVRNTCSVFQNNILSSFSPNVVSSPSLPRLSNSHLTTNEGLLKASPKKKTLITPSLENLGITLSKPNRQTQVRDSKTLPAPTDAESISSGNTKTSSDQVDSILREGDTTIQEDQDSDTITQSHGEELPDRSDSKKNMSSETVIIEGPTRIDVPQSPISDTDELPIPPTGSQIHVSPREEAIAMSPISTPQLQATELEKNDSPVSYPSPIPPPSSPILPMPSPPFSSAQSSLPSSVSSLQCSSVNGERNQKEEKERVQPVCRYIIAHIRFDDFNNIKDWTLKPKLQHQVALIKEQMKRDELERRRVDDSLVKDKEETEVVAKTQQLSRTGSGSSLTERQKKEDEEEEKRKRKEKVVKARLAERDRKRKNSVKERRMVEQNIEPKKESTRPNTRGRSNTWGYSLWSVAKFCYFIKNG